MSKACFISLLTLYVLLVLLLILSTDTSSVLATPEGRHTQFSIWQSIPKYRVFLTFQVLYGSLFCGFLGILGLFFFWGPARYLWFVAVLGLVLYYRLDPRYLAFEWVSLVRGLSILCLGVLSHFLFFRFRDKEVSRNFLNTYLVLMSCFVVSLFVASLSTHLPLIVMFRITMGEWAVRFLLFLSGFLFMAMSVGGPSRFFIREYADSFSGLSRKKITISFIGSTVFFMLLCVAILRGASLENLHWILFSPLVPVFMTIYAPITWFSKDSIAQVFSPDAIGAIGTFTTSARLYLGLFFQYLVITTILLLYLSIKHKHRTSLLIAAHFMLVLYWLPTLWLALQLARN